MPKANVDPKGSLRRGRLSMAIMAFEKVERKGHQLERAELELSIALAAMPNELLQEYAGVTEELRKKLEAQYAPGLSSLAMRWKHG